MSDVIVRIGASLSISVVRQQCDVASAGYMRGSLSEALSRPPLSIHLLMDEPDFTGQLIIDGDVVNATTRREIAKPHGSIYVSPSTNHYRIRRGQ